MHVRCCDMVYGLQCGSVHVSWWNSEGVPLIESNGQTHSNTTVENCIHIELYLISVIFK